MTLNLADNRGRGPMRAHALATLAILIAPVAVALAGTESPYPWGDLSLTWRPSTYRFSGVGGDIWTVTWGADGQLHTAWGDGNVGCGRYV